MALERDTEISVIIPAHNEEKYIHKTLKSLKKQTYKNFEIIVVAADCNDETAQLAKNGCSVLIVLEERDKSKAMNEGAKKANGDILIFLDADTLLNKVALNNIAKRFSRRYAVGTLKRIPEKKNFSYIVYSMFKNFIHFTHVWYGSSGVIICWKDNFFKEKGFREDLFPKEVRPFIKSMLNYGKFLYLRSATATTSMRRFKKSRMIKLIYFWAPTCFKSFFKNLSNVKYEVIR